MASSQFTAFGNRFAGLFPLAIAAALVFTQAAHAGPHGQRWSHYPGFFSPGYAGMQAVDFDHDGIDEILVSGSAENGFSPVGQSFIAVFRKETGGFRISNLAPLAVGETFRGELVSITPAGCGDVVTIAAIDDGMGAVKLATFSGPGLVPTASVPAPTYFKLDGVADVDHDGELEAFGTVSEFAWDKSAPKVLDLATGAVEWDGGSYLSTSVTAGQLDADPQLELVLSDSSGFEVQKGYVIDGSSHSVDWEWPDGFQGRALTGNFLAAYSGNEIAIVEPWGSTRIFVSQPSYSPITDYATGEIQAQRAHDVNGDGVDEIVVGEGQWGSIIGYSASDWLHPSFTVSNPEHGVSAVALGEFDGSAGVDVAWGAGLTSTGKDIVGIARTSDGIQIFEKADEAGPHASLLVGDFDNGGSEEVAYLTRESNSGYDGPNIVVLDAKSGEVLRRRDGVMRSWGGPEWIPMVSANLDADPQPELILGGDELYDRQIMVVDGKTLETQWSITGDFGDFAALALVQANGDSVLDVVAAAGGKLGVYSGVNGDLLWQSTEYTVTGRQSLLVADLDDDGQPEIAYGLGDKVYVLDAQTHLVEQPLSFDIDIIGQSVEEDAGDCVHILYGVSELIRRACSGAELSRRSYGPDVNFVRAPEGSTEALLLANDEQIWVDEAGRPDRVLSTSTGAQTGFADLGVLGVAGTEASLYVGSGLGVFRIDYGTRTIHEGGFE